MAMRCLLLESHYIPLVIIFVATVGSAAGFLAPGKFCFNASNAGESQIVKQAEHQAQNLPFPHIFSTMVC